VKSNYKPKIGIFGLTGCGGDQLTILNMEDDLIELLGNFELVQFQMGSSRRGNSILDIALVEGSVSTKTDLQRLKEIREKATYLVAIGNCSIDGCLQAGMSGENSIKVSVKEVYGEEAKFDSEFLDAKGAVDYVPVDFKIPGCPIEKKEILQALTSMLHGDFPQEFTYPVCVECKLNEYPCLITEKGESCLGPIIRGGCNARCPGLGVDCIGCRGPPLDNVNISKEFKLLLEEGYNNEYVMNRLRMFSGNTEARSRIKKLLEESE